MGKQLHLSQVIASLNRRKDCYNIFCTLYELKQLCRQEYDSKILEIIPIKIIACFEDFFRIKYEKIIDNALYRKNLKDIDIFKNLKFDFDVLGAFQNNSITLGEYLSYLIPCSKPEDIIGTLQKLLNIDFIEKLKEQKESSPVILNSINEIFRLRHILCHEVAKTEELNSELVLRLLNDAYDFLSISEKIIDDILYPDTPQTTYEMNLASGKILNEVNQELEFLIEEIKTKDLEGKNFYTKFEYIEDWKRYREARAKIESSDFEGGSMYPIVYNLYLAEITKAFIKEISEKYKYLLKR